MPRITLNLDTRDAAFATELAYGTLRWRDFLDAVIDRCSQRSDIDVDIRDLLRLGTYQLLFMRVPDHAAVDSTCNLVEGPHAQGRRGFINAVLRRVAEHSRDEWSELITLPDARDDLALHTSHPRWIVDSLQEALEANGRDAHDLRALLDVDNEPARPVLMARSLAPDDLLSDARLSPGRWSPRAAILSKGSPSDIPAVQDRSAIMQDEGSQLVALALAAIPVSPPEVAWLDMCAGPGGKAALLEQLARERDVRVTVVELHQHRADLMEQVLGPQTIVHVADARQRPWGAMFFDRVLVDAPCSGLGALRRRPEARWRKSASDIPELAALQESLLDVAIDATRTDGVIAYVTCSPHVRETIHVIEDVLTRRDDVELLDARPYFPEGMDLGPHPWVQLWPDLHGTDAMFFAAMRRVSR